MDVSYPSGMVALTNETPETPFIRVQAFRSKSFNGIPDASVLLLAPGTCRIAGLEDGESYYIRAYIEQNGDAERANWESWGYYRAGNGAVNPYVPVAVKAGVLGNAPSPYAVTIRDCDTDNDLLPDAYEWASVTNLSAFGVADFATAVKKTIAYAMAPRSLLQSPSVASADADADGFTDYEEFLMGFDASSPETLKITSIVFDADGNPVVDWTWDGPSTGSSAGATGRAGSPTAATLASSVVYEVQAKVELSDAEWTTVHVVETNLVDGEAVVSAAEAPAGVDVSVFRFFRIKVSVK